MESVQRVGDLNAEIKQAFRVQRLAADPMAEGLALQQFHGDEGPPIGLVDLVNSANIRMIQRRRSLGFPLKTAESLRAFRRAVRQELERDKAAEPHILSLEYDSHGAGAELFNHTIMRDGLANHWRESYFRQRGESMRSQGSAGVHEHARW